jgi:hypothetical protein
LVVRAGALGDVLVAVQNVADDRTRSVHGAFALTVSVGPVVVLNPASKSAVVGAVSAVEPAVICSRTTRPAVIETLPGWVQLSPEPVAVHWARAIAGSDVAASIIAIDVRHSPVNLFISSPVQLEKFRKTWSHPVKNRSRYR